MIGAVGSRSLSGSRKLRRRMGNAAAGARLAFDLRLAAKCDRALAPICRGLQTQKNRIEPCLLP